MSSCHICLWWNWSDVWDHSSSSEFWVWFGLVKFLCIEFKTCPNRIYSGQAGESVRLRSNGNIQSFWRGYRLLPSSGTCVSVGPTSLACVQVPSCWCMYLRWAVITFMASPRGVISHSENVMMICETSLWTSVQWKAGPLQQAGKENRLYVAGYPCAAWEWDSLSGSILLLRNLNDWLLSDDKSSLPYYPLAGISGAHLYAPSSFQWQYLCWF